MNIHVKAKNVVYIFHTETMNRRFSCCTTATCILKPLLLKPLPLNGLPTSLRACVCTYQGIVYVWGIIWYHCNVCGYIRTLHCIFTVCGYILCTVYSYSVLQETPLIFPQSTLDINGSEHTQYLLCSILHLELIPCSVELWMNTTNDNVTKSACVSAMP